MTTKEIQEKIRGLVEKLQVTLHNISVNEEDPKNVWISLEISEPHLFTSHEGEGLNALSHLLHRMLEEKGSPSETRKPTENVVIVDINGFQKKRVENIRAIAHMMSERARYFKSNIEVDPMTAFERRIVHEFLADATDLKTESVGFGSSRRVVIKYTGGI